MNRVRLDWVMEPLRDTVALSEMHGQTVFHYSIPVIDTTGDGAYVEGSEIESAKQRLAGGEVLVSRLNPRKSRVLLTIAKDVLAVCSGEFVVLRPRPGTDPNYVLYLLLAETTRCLLDSQVRSVTKSQQRVDPDTRLRAAEGTDSQEE